MSLIKSALRGAIVANNLRSKTISLYLSLFILLMIPTSTRAQQGYVEFLATGATYCGNPLHVFGFQVDPTHWETEMMGFVGGSNSGSYLYYNWQLTDATGVVASGSYDSRQGDSGGSGGFQFQTAAPLVFTDLSQISFSLEGAQYNTSPPCGQSFIVSTNTTISSGGYVKYE